MTKEESTPKGPPPLRPFGLVLCHDGRFLHEGAEIANRKLREHFDRSVAYLPDQKKYIVHLRHFRGEIEIEEAGFFVREVDLDTGVIRLSDGTSEPLVMEDLAASPIDGALLCRVKRDLAEEGLPARFLHAAQAELLQAVEPAGEGFEIELAGQRVSFPEVV